MGRILHLSDIHFGAENKAAVAAAAECAHAGNFDLTAITGDITQFGHEAEFDAAAAWVQALPHPVLITPGNHDTPWAGVVDRVFSPFGRYQRRFGAPGKAGHDGRDLAARAFNTARGVQVRLNWSKGEVFASQAQDAAESLAQAPAGVLRAVLCHHPLVEVVGGPMTAKVRGGERAAQMLCEAQVDVVLTGHIHVPFAAPLPGGDGKTYAVGAGTLSLRERGMAPSFNIVDWDADTLNIAAHAWTGSHFEVLRTWALARRQV